MGYDDDIPVSIIAKDYGMTAAKFNLLLREAEIQYKIRGAGRFPKKHRNNKVEKNIKTSIIKKVGARLTTFMRVITTRCISRKTLE